MSSWGHYAWASNRKVGDPVAKALLLLIAMDTNPLDYRSMEYSGCDYRRPAMEAVESYFELLELSQERGERLIRKLLSARHLIEHFGFVPAWPEPEPEPRERTIPLKTRRIFNRDGWKCAYCGSEKSLSLDHVLARSRGGGNEDANLLTACRSCNSSKGNRLLSEWRPNFDLIGDII